MNSSDAIRPGAVPPTDFGFITVTDDSGRQVRLPRAARRIVTLSPHATELVYAAGAGNRLVAVASYSDWPPAAKQKPTIGSFGGLDRERLLSLAPELIIAWDSGNRPGDLAWLDRMGIAVYRSEPKLLEDIARNLTDIGRLAGSGQAADAAAQAFRHAIAQPCPAPTHSGFIQLADSPLVTIGKRHWLNQALRLAGVENIFADQDKSVFSVGPEAMLARRPQLQLSSAPFGTAYAPRQIQLQAAYWNRPGPRLAQGIQRLCRQLAEN